MLEKLVCIFFFTYYLHDERKRLILYVLCSLSGVDCTENGNVQKIMKSPRHTIPSTREVGRTEFQILSISLPETA